VGTDGFTPDALGEATILHYDGAKWSIAPSPAPSYFFQIWGSSPSDVWAVGVGGVIIHYDGTSWSSVPSGTTNELSAIWGTSATDVWAVGYQKILHYDGMSWSSSANVMSWVIGVWGTSPSDVWAVSADPYGHNDAFRHYDGAQWTTYSSGQLTADDYPVGIWGTSSSNVWVVTSARPKLCCGKIFHYNGSSWSMVPTGTTTIPNFNGIWGSSASDIWAVSDEGIFHGTPAR
jgi:uncharacterized membrane protein